MGGTLSADSIENCGHFNQTGGNLVIQNGLDNTGLFSYSGGSFIGRLVNYGTVYFNGYFLATNGLANYSTVPLVIDSGHNIALTGQGLDNQGIIVVNGMLSGESLLNGRTGSLHGTGTIMGCLTNNGVLRPSGGTLNVSGSFTQSASGTMETGITSLTSYDRLNIQGSFILTKVDSSHLWYSYYPGTAALNGSLKPILLGSYAPDAGQVFNILTAADGVSGTFSSIINQYITPTLSWQLRYGTNTVDLFVQRDYANSLLGLDPNRSSVGRALNSLAAEAAGDPDSAAASTIWILF